MRFDFTGTSSHIAFASTFIKDLTPEAIAVLNMKAWHPLIPQKETRTTYEPCLELALQIDTVVAPPTKGMGKV
jgi:hypothetical protein